MQKKAVQQSEAKDSYRDDSELAKQHETESLQTDKSPADFAHLVTIKAEQHASIVSELNSSDRPGPLPGLHRENTMH